MHFSFSKEAIDRLLYRRRVHLVGVHYSGCDNMLQAFVDQSIWTNGYAEHGDKADNPMVQRYNQRTKDIQQGDYLVAKRMCGRGSPDMAILAIGIVLARRNDATVYVAWMEQFEHPISVPLKEVGTISAVYDGRELDKSLGSIALTPLLKRARDKFLAENLSTVLRTY
jgi:hypothetical protein